MQKWHDVSGMTLVDSGDADADEDGAADDDDDDDDIGHYSKNQLADSDRHVLVTRAHIDRESVVNQ